MVTHRAGHEVGLAVSPPTDDDSPHLNVWAADAKAATPTETKGAATEDFPAAPELDDCNDGQDPAAAGADGAASAAGEATEAADGAGAALGASRVSREAPSYIPSHLHESTEPDAPQHEDYGHEEKALEPPYPLETGLTSEALTSDDTDDGGYPLGLTPPTGYPLHRRVPSSSIPHMLSASNSFTADPAQLIEIQSQLSFVGMGCTSPSLASMGSRHESLAFSVDGDDAAFRAGPSHPQNQTTAKNVGIPSSLECGSHLSSSASLASFNLATPPAKVPSSAKGLVLGMPQLNEPPSSIYNLNPASIEEGKVNSTIISPGEGPVGGLIMPNQQLPTRYPMPSAVQPVLYSAINSLERYNAGSFDNKVMLAKARGTYGRQKAFPGVPKKKMDQLSLGSSMDSKASSVVSGVAMSKCSSIDEEEGKPAGGRLLKSKSSGNLSEKRQEETTEKLKAGQKGNKGPRVTINDEKPVRRRRREKKKPMGVFRPSSDAYTPRMGNRAIKYKPAAERECVDKMASTMGTIQRPNFRDALRRVAIILHQHIVKIERRFSTGKRGLDDTGLFKASMRDQFHEDNFATPRYKCSMVRVPMARPGVVYSMRKIQIYEFAHQLFKKVQLSSECSIVCLIYVEKLMEVAKVPLVAETWRPIFMAGLLLASKVWQDLSSWNIEFASVYPQFSLDAINRLELSFLKHLKWDLYISSSSYAKYYFALRSLLEKAGFRDRYNQMVGGGIGGIAAAEAMKVSKRSEAVKEEALLQLSRSM
ncbi:hypothetical protein ACHAXT_008090 [Thalassiosira profunda]